MDLMQQSFGITLVFALLGLSLWWLKKKGLTHFAIPAKAANKREIEALGKVLLTPQHSIHVVRIQNRLLYLGVSPAGIRVLQSRGRSGRKRGQPRAKAAGASR